MWPKPNDGRLVINYVAERPRNRWLSGIEHGANGCRSEPIYERRGNFRLPITLDPSFLKSARYRITKMTTTHESDNIFTLPSVGCTAG